MTENAIFLIFGILLILAFVGLAAITSCVVEFLFPTQIEKLEEKLDIPTDDWDEWDELIY